MGGGVRGGVGVLGDSGRRCGGCGKVLEAMCGLWEGVGGEHNGHSSPACTTAVEEDCANKFRAPPLQSVSGSGWRGAQALAATVGETLR